MYRILACLYFLLFPAMPLFAAVYPLQSDVVGQVGSYIVRHDDNLYEIARRFDIGIVELLAANPGTDPWQPLPGSQLILTTRHVLPEAERQGIVINLSELRLFYYPGNGTVMTFPIGIGKEGWQTPTGSTLIAKKRKNPSWIPPTSIREEKPDLPEIIPPGPENPLGAHALNLGWPGYVIHGTNRPYGIGKRSSHGCIRLYPEDISLLFDKVKEGTPVTIIDTPYKLGWQGNGLFLEITPTQQQADAIAEYHRPASVSIPEIYEAIRMKAQQEIEIYWYEVDQAIAHRSGIPLLIGKKSAF